MLQLEEALNRILAVLPSAEAESLPLAEGRGRVLLHDLVSPADLPAFANSAMDGYALRAAEVAAAAASTPVRLAVSGRVPAGQGADVPVDPGHCVRLFTGSPMPAGADAVVMQEDTRTLPGTADILVLAPVVSGENVRLAGDDVRRGSLLVKSGERLRPAQLNLMAAVGVNRLTVGRAPVVGLLATGSELKEPGQPLARGEIFESNRPGLAALLESCRAVPRMLPLVADGLAVTCEALLAGFSQCDMIVTCGGVSVGEFDYLKSAFHHIGGDLNFWQVAIRPGKPFVFGQYRNKFLFGLPGNPVSAFVTCLLLVRPAVLRWQGAGEVELPARPGRLVASLDNPGSRRHFARVRLDRFGSVQSAGTQASHALGSLSRANGLVDVPAHATLPAGETVKVLQWE